MLIVNNKLLKKVKGKIKPWGKCRDPEGYKTPITQNSVKPNVISCGLLLSSNDLGNRGPPKQAEDEMKVILSFRVVSLGCLRQFLGKDNEKHLTFFKI